MTRKHSRFLKIADAIKREARITRHHINESFPRYEGGGVLHAPEGRTVSELYILAHECGHAIHRHNRRTPKWLAEYQAELWAHEALQRHGVAISKARTASAKANVRLELSAAWDFPDTKIAAEASEWSGEPRTTGG